MPSPSAPFWPAGNVRWSAQRCTLSYVDASHDVGGSKELNRFIGHATDPTATPGASGFPGPLMPFTRTLFGRRSGS